MCTGDPPPPRAEPGRAGAAGRDGSLLWVVPGPLGQATGGYLYDARIVEELGRLGWAVRVADVACRGWPLDLPAARRLVRAVRDRAPDLVVFDELAHPAMALGIPWLRATRAGRGARLVGLVHHLRASEPAPRVERRVARAVERAALGGLDAIVCTSRHTAGTVGELLRRPVRIGVAPPGIDTRPPAPVVGDPDLGQPNAGRRGHPNAGRPGHQAPSATRMGDPDGAGGQPTAGRLRVLCVAHWTPRKGILTALAAVARAPAGVSLDLVGDRDRDPAYARRVGRALRHPSLAGRVRAHGVVSDARLAALYRGADAFLLASTHEGYGMVLAEALRAGLPIVATDVGAVPELLGPDSGAALLAPGDAAGMARELARLAGDPPERARRARLAAGRGRALPTWADSARAFDRLLRDALGGRHPDASPSEAPASRAPRRAAPRPALPRTTP